MSGGWSVKSWVRPLPEWSPESLPGYAEAAEKVARGEKLFTPHVPGPAPRRRTADELRLEIALLRVKRDGLGVVSDDPAAARLSGTATRKQSARLDSELAKWSSLNDRIVALEAQLARVA